MPSSAPDLLTKTQLIQRTTIANITHRLEQFSVRDREGRYDNYHQRLPEKQVVWWAELGTKFTGLHSIHAALDSCCFN